jgi:iron(III) transport system ATP-binding protein
MSSGVSRVFTPPEKRGMGMVFQSYALWPHMTVFENVAYPLKRRKTPSKEIPDRVAAALQTVGMGGFHNRPAPLLSGGQAQRVALARALEINPEVLLLDEPLSNQDARLREEMRFELRALQTRVGVTAIFVTHDQAEAMVLSDRTIVMSTGHIEQVGTPSEVYEHPASRFVMDFLGQVNHVAGRVARAPRGEWVAQVPDAGGALLPLGDEQPWREDQDVVLAFRPQDITLRPANGDAHWMGTVQTVAYMGTHVEYLVRLGSSDIRALGPRVGHLEQGATARCDVDLEQIRAWPVA